MYRMSAVVLALALAMYAPLAHADSGPKRLSVDFSLGVKPDMANLGLTIAKDGTLDTGDTTMARMVYSTDQAIMSDRSNLVLWHNSQNTNSSFRLLGEAPETGGPLLGLDIGGSARYELDDVLGVPLYVKAGFYYTSRVSGGQQKRVLGDAAAANPRIAQLLVANGEDPNDYIGGTMFSSYDASWIEIPLQVGIKVPLARENSFLYAGVGMSLFRGGFSVGLDVDERYANVLATHIDTDALTVTNLSPGAVKETMKFQIGGAGLNWSLGAQSYFGKNVAVFMELNTSGAAKTVYSSQMSPEARRLLTATSSATLAQDDPEWFKRLSFPVVTGGALVRTGVRYYFF